MSWKKWESKSTLITGASSGLGAEFARQLAKRKCPLLITARRVERLQQLKEELISLGSPRVEWVEADLNSSGAATFLRQHAESIDFKVEGLINNAGLGHYAYFENHNKEKIDNLIHVNISAVVHLAHEFLPIIKKAPQGLILNVASIASFIPLPRLALYSASKAFVSNWSMGLNQELKDSNILSHVLCPGPTESEFMQVAANNPIASAKGKMESQPVIEGSLNAVDNKKMIYISGGKNKIMAFLTRLIPYSFLVQLADKFNNRPVAK